MTPPHIKRLHLAAIQEGGAVELPPPPPFIIPKNVLVGTVLADGGWVVTWSSDKDDTHDVYGQIYNADGSNRGGEIHVASPGYQYGATVTALEAGGFMLAWDSSDDLDIVATAPGKVVPSERVKTIQPLETSIIRAVIHASVPNLKHPIRRSAHGGRGHQGAAGRHARQCRLSK